MMKRYKLIFRPDLTESGKKKLQKEYDDYLSSLNAKGNSCIEYPLSRWVEQGNSPYTNPEWRFDKKTGELMDFWSAKLEKDEESTIGHLSDLMILGRWKELENIKEYIDELMVSYKYKR